MFFKASKHRNNSITFHVIDQAGFSSESAKVVVIVSVTAVEAVQAVLVDLVVS